jgi:acyl carrier protein
VEGRAMTDPDAIKLRQILIAILELDEDASLDGLKRGDPANWDSLAQATLNAAIEDEFGLAFSLADYDQLNSYADINALLSTRLARA